MSDAFLDPIIYSKRTQGYEFTQEDQLISGSRILLSSRPDWQQKVIVKYNVSAFSASVPYNLYDVVSYSGSIYRCSTATSAGSWNISKWTVMPNGILMSEVSQISPEIGKYKVDYITGIVNFNINDNAKSVRCEFYSVGNFKIPSSMVYTKSENNLATESLEEMIDNYNLYTEDIRIDNEQARISNEDIRISQESTRVSQENTRKSQESARVIAEANRVAGGALIKSGDTMNGDLTMSSDNGIIMGNMKINFNSGLGVLDITTI